MQQLSHFVGSSEVVKHTHEKPANKRAAHHLKCSTAFSEMCPLLPLKEIKKITEFINLLGYTASHSISEYPGGEIRYGHWK
jgi:hypothetical protein